MTYMGLFPVFLIQQTSRPHTLILRNGHPVAKDSNGSCDGYLPCDASRGLMTEKASYLQPATRQRVNVEECKVSHVHSASDPLGPIHSHQWLFSSASTERCRVRWEKKERCHVYQ